MKLATASQIAAELGVHRVTVQTWARQPDFPEPLQRVGNARAWDLDEVLEWHRTTDRRPGRPSRR